jgi:hypothetical protein
MVDLESIIFWIVAEDERVVAWDLVCFGYDNRLIHGLAGRIAVAE